jgi:putative NADH-flavin reductase
MTIALAEATGLIGSHVLTELQQRGHEGTALVRNTAQAGTVAARGAAPAVVDLVEDRREDVTVHHKYIADIEARGPEALTTVNPVPYDMRYGRTSGPG